MLRNHVIGGGDAESPMKTNPNNNNSNNNNSMNDMNDEWYSSSGAPDSSSNQYSSSNYMNTNSQPQNIFNNYNNYNNNSNMNNGMNMGMNQPTSNMMGQNMNMNMGNMSGSFGNNNGGLNMNSYSFDDEPPLLEELGIRFDHIWSKTQAVMYPMRKINRNMLDDADLAGPLMYCLLLGSALLLTGKVHFGYIYGFSTFGCISMYTVINLIHPHGLDFWKVCSVLGYCLLPVIALAAAAIVIDLKGWLGFFLAFGSIIWATLSSTRLLDGTIELTDQYWLVAYPVMLLYSCFVLITIY